MTTPKKYLIKNILHSLCIINENLISSKEQYVKVKEKITVREAREKAISDTNYYFSKTNTPIIINKMNKYDLKSCCFRSMISQHCLAWNDYEHYLNDEHCYNFCFKIISLDIDKSITNRPEAACICTYNIFDKCISIEIIQNFSKENKIINGSMMKYSLLTIFLFLTKIEGNGIYLINPINNEIKNYYVNVFGFNDINKDGKTLFLSFENLANWYLTLI